MSVTIRRTVVSYDFPRPPKLSESDYKITRQNLPVHPYINIREAMLKEYGVNLAIRSVFFFMPDGTYTSARNYYHMLKEKKKFYEKLYEAIYNSKTYDEYSKKYDELVKK